LWCDQECLLDEERVLVAFVGLGKAEEQQEGGQEVVLRTTAAAVFQPKCKSMKALSRYRAGDGAISSHLCQRIAGAG
jgi:hypothetical protein